MGFVLADWQQVMELAARRTSCVWLWSVSLTSLQTRKPSSSSCAASYWSQTHPLSAGKPTAWHFIFTGSVDLWNIQTGGLLKAQTWMDSGPILQKTTSFKTIWVNVWSNYLILKTHHWLMILYVGTQVNLSRRCCWNWLGPSGLSCLHMDAKLPSLSTCLDTSPLKHLKQRKRFVHRFYGLLLENFRI